ncbi:methylosome subunit pICln-like protein 2 [Sarcoptes scabiei]|uniref:Methylosome subunit pICln-like protein 2 n=1 Tax=Sarcoptes scabiei TaxID=52283 RepID=A0A132ABX4_SARSC|nr:methylosome subunit pICln-like protein 2 [Sarcoptes scabiei]
MKIPRTNSDNCKKSQFDFLNLDLLKLIWRIENGQGFVLHYPQISLHAISRDLSNFHAECLFLLFEDQNNLFQIDPTEIEPPSSLSNHEKYFRDTIQIPESLSK